LAKLHGDGFEFSNRLVSPKDHKRLTRLYLANIFEWISLAFINCYAGHYFLSIYLMNKLEEKKDRILLTFKQAEIGRYTY
jgi:hypothetical protein